jgi:putative GTP pyrophosphokinase
MSEPLGNDGRVQVLAMTKTQVDRLGDRLKKGNVSDADLRALDEYRRSFAPVYESVVNVIRERLNLEPTGRPAKSTPSIVDKLQRESIRLSQIQDIADCRAIVDDIRAQVETVDRLVQTFEDSVVVDRRKNPSHGYRAVHVIVRSSGKLIEVQVRTVLQHMWAELSEKLADLIDPAVKYGGGTEPSRSMLIEMCQLVTEAELLEQQLLELAKNALSEKQWPGDLQNLMTSARSQIVSIRQMISQLLQNTIARYDKGDTDVVSR